MKKFFYICLVLRTIVFVVLILSGCNLAASAKKSQVDVEIPDEWIQLKTDDFSIYLPDSWEGRSAQELATIIKTQLQITPTETTNSDNKPLLVFL